MSPSAIRDPRSAPHPQASLPLGDEPGSEASLRDAFARAGLARYGWTFERAINNDAMRRCLANINHARLKAATTREAT